MSIGTIFISLLASNTLVFSYLAQSEYASSLHQELPVGDKKTIVGTVPVDVVSTHII